MTRGTMVHYAGFWKPNRTRLIAQLWDFIETSSFREDIKGIKDNDDDYNDKEDNNKNDSYDKDFNNDKDISSLR